MELEALAFDMEAAGRLRITLHLHEGAQFAGHAAGVHLVGNGQFFGVSAASAAEMPAATCMAPLCRRVRLLVGAALATTAACGLALALAVCAGSAAVLLAALWRRSCRPAAPPAAP